MNGSVVVVDPANGRVLSIVNQKLALKSGFIPCSTIKLVTALAALSEQLDRARHVDPHQPLRQLQPDHRHGALQQPVSSRGWATGSASSA